MNKFEASMILAGVGDALGFHRTAYEFCLSGPDIHDDVARVFGSVENIHLKGEQWIVSDDTVMHLASAEALIEASHRSNEELYQCFRDKYRECMKDMNSRGPGKTCIRSVSAFDMTKPDGYRQPFDINDRSGCGAAMRAMCIGLRYFRETELDQLIAVSVEAGRMTHHHPIGYLGSFVAAYFTSLALQGVPLLSWGSRLLLVLPRVQQYIADRGFYVEENLANWQPFVDLWTQYLETRGLSSGTAQPKELLADGDVAERDNFYRSLMSSTFPGSTGLDSVIIAYDALLACNGSWIEFCRRGALHCGDCDSTGGIGGAWFGALYGFEGVPEHHYKELEYVDRLRRCAHRLFELSRASNGPP